MYLLLILSLALADDPPSAPPGWTAADPALEPPGPDEVGTPVEHRGVRMPWPAGFEAPCARTREPCDQALVFTHFHGGDVRVMRSDRQGDAALEEAARTLHFARARYRTAISETSVGATGGRLITLREDLRSLGLGVDLRLVHLIPVQGGTVVVAGSAPIDRPDLWHPIRDAVRAARPVDGADP